MRLVRLIYSSHVNQNVGKEEVDEILSKAKKNNKELNITGILCFSNRYFLQCLEGESNAVNSIYHKIAKDKRHTNLQIIGFENVNERLFEKWEMKLFLANKENQEKILKYSISPDFDPEGMNQKSATKFLKSLIE